MNKDEIIKSINKELKERFPDTKYKPWMKNYIFGVVYGGETNATMADQLGMSRTTIYNYLDDDIRQYVEELRDRRFLSYEQKVTNLIEDALDAYSDLIKSADTDATRLRAAEMVLKKFNLLEERSTVDHTGAIGTYKIEFTTEPVESDDDA